jgi:hypothetical protein
LRAEFLCLTFVQLVLNPDFILPAGRLTGSDSLKLADILPQAVLLCPEHMALPQTENERALCMTIRSKSANEISTKRLSNI